MKDNLKRLLGLLLVLSTSAWSQALCPMMLFPQSSPCGTHQLAASAAGVQASEHDCCPHQRRAMSTHQQCPSPKLSDSSNMSCCSVERAPATSSKSVQPSPDVTVTGRVSQSAIYVPAVSRSASLADSGAPLRGVLSLKEDLRI